MNTMVLAGAGHSGVIRVRKVVKVGGGVPVVPVERPEETHSCLVSHHVMSSAPLGLCQ